MLLASLFAAVNLAACDFGERNPKAPEELEQYAFLIGNHKIRAWRWDAENRNWGKGYLETRWNGWWALDGFAVADEWHDVQYPGQPPATGGGVNIRMWDAEHQQWSNMWMHTGAAQTTELISKMEDGKMVMYRKYPEQTRKTRVEFEINDDGSWTRYTYYEDEDGSLTPFGRLDAFKIPCDE